MKYNDYNEGYNLQMEHKEAEALYKKYGDKAFTPRIQMELPQNTAIIIDEAPEEISPEKEKLLDRIRKLALVSSQ
ncbi:Uncharacterised protein [uncultured archaeon]|nr:Uncharacterised protein [uncultured archaeon]